jgi:hypothetical protein
VETLLQGADGSDNLFDILFLVVGGNDDYAVALMHDKFRFYCLLLPQSYNILRKEVAL